MRLLVLAEKGFVPLRSQAVQGKVLHQQVPLPKEDVA